MIEEPETCAQGNTTPTVSPPMSSPVSGSFFLRLTQCACAGDISDLSEKMYVLNVLPEDCPFSPTSPPAAPTELLRKNAFLHEEFSTPPSKPRPCATPLRNEEQLNATRHAAPQEPEVALVGKMQVSPQCGSDAVGRGLGEDESQEEVLAAVELALRGEDGGASEVEPCKDEVAAGDEVVPSGEDGGTSEAAPHQDELPEAVEGALPGEDVVRVRLHLIKMRLL